MSTGPEHGIGSGSDFHIIATRRSDKTYRINPVQLFVMSVVAGLVLHVLQD